MPVQAYLESPAVNKIPDRLRRDVAQQLAFPTGVAARLVLPVLDRVNDSLIDGAVDILKARRGSRVTDIGCGGGRGVRRLLADVGPSGLVHAIDPSPAVTGRAVKNHRADIAAGNLTVDTAPMDDLPFKDNSIDGAMSTNTVYYISDLDAAFAEVHRVLAPGGTFVVGVGDPGFMSRLPIAGHGPILRPIIAITDRLDAAGLVIDDHIRLDPSPDAFHVIRTVKPRT